MRYEFAPLEGLTDSLYRRLHHSYFPGVDRYFTPFLSPTIHRRLTHREERELPPAESLDFTVVPQILSKVPEDFLWAAEQCQQRGYSEVNLNLGCPSGTVVSKGKGSGLLANPDGLQAFLDEIFSKTPLPVSIKTRIGITEPDEFPRLLEIYNRYPLSSLIIHPRTRKAFYKGSVHMDVFEECLRHSKNPVCYNGNVCSLSQIKALESKYPQLEGIMIGRGLIGDPGMLTPGATVTQLEAFCNTLLEVYTAEFGGPRNAMFRMKEHWGYLLHHFEGNEKLGKRLRKTTDLQEYKDITAAIFHTLPFSPVLDPDW